MHLLGSLADNQICGIDERGTYNAEGINALCEALKDNNTLTILKYAHQLEHSSNLPTNSVNSHCHHSASTLLFAHSLGHNGLTDEAKQAVKDAAGSSVRITF